MATMLPEQREIRCSHSDSLPALLAELGLSVLVSTYQTGHVVVVAARQGRLVLTFHQFDRAMGIAVKSDCLAVCTGKEVWFARSVPDLVPKLEPQGQFDACFLARTCHFTGDIRAHEAAWVGSEFWVVNTLFSCLSALHPYYSFAPRWRPGFVSELSAEDRCHLNGLAVAEGKPRFATALGETNTAAGWRPILATGGCLLEVPSGRVVARGLSVPHSPRIHGERLFVLQSGLGRLDLVDPTTGRMETVADVPGVPRGLAIHRHLAWVGLSKARPTLTGVPIVDKRDALKCGLAVVDLQRGRIIAELEFHTGVEEIFDVQVLPGIKSPHLSGPWAERDTGRAFWCVPPA